MGNVQICEFYSLFNCRFMRSQMKWNVVSRNEMGKMVKFVFIASSEATAKIYLESLRKQLTFYSEESLDDPQDRTL
jgi:hypothetical protein